MKISKKWLNDYTVPQIDPYKRQKDIQIIDISNFESLNSFLSK